MAYVKELNDLRAANTKGNHHYHFHHCNYNHHHYHYNNSFRNVDGISRREWPTAGSYTNPNSQSKERVSGDIV